VPAYTSSDIRNIALLGPAGSGKTTLTEMLLHRSGMIPAPGDIKQGTTVSDHDPQEKELQHSINASVVHLDHEGVHINLIDTPGSADFAGRAISVLPAVETAAIVIDAEAGVGTYTQTLMAAAARRNLCRIIVINHIDASMADIGALLAHIKEAFGNECLPLNLPAGNGANVIDCFFQPEGGETDVLSIRDAHTQIIDQVVEVDEELMEVYLEQGQELKPGQLHNPFEKALREGHLIPICFTSAVTGAGVDRLLDVFVRLMPNPMEGNPPPYMLGEAPDIKPVDISPDPKKHVLAHVFKVTIDPFVGRLGIFRIHQGTVNRDSQLFIGDGRKPFKVSHLFKLQGKDHVEADAGIPGDICAVGKVDAIHFDAVLHDSHEDDHMHLKSMDCPAPMYGLAIVPSSHGHEQKLAEALHKLESEDPCCLVEHNAATNETIIRGLGELHLRVMLDRMRDQYHVEVTTHPPRIAYRETITAPAEGHHRHKKQTGGAGQFGEVFLRIEPIERGSGFEFVDQISGGVIPSQFLPAVEKGVRQVMNTGSIAGYPMQDIRVTVYDGKHHAVDSKEVAFVAAGKKAFLDAVHKARPIIMEPIVKIVVTVPDTAVGDITGDLSGRRGRITGTDSLPNNQARVSAEAPLGELSEYQSELKSATGGQGNYRIEFSHYEQVPARIQQELAAGFRPHQEDE